MNILKKIIFLNPEHNENLEIQYDVANRGNNGKKRILIFVENVNATYYLSFHYVLELLYQKGEVDFVVLSSKTILNYLNNKNYQIDSFIDNVLEDIKPQTAIFSRYALPYGKSIWQRCQEQKINTIYHIDDDLLNIPLSLGQGIQKQHGNQEVIQEREYLLSHVNLIYASTQYLDRTLAKRFPQQEVFSGIYAPYLESLINKSKIINSNDLTIGYMGSKGHRNDLKMIAPAIAQILTEYPQIKFETFGTISIPDGLQKFSDRITSHQVKVNYSQFLQKLYELNWDIGLAPLENTDFNQCKAPTKLIEYTACDIPTIASNVNVYNQFVDGKEVILAEPWQWYEKIKFSIENSDFSKKILQNAKVRCEKEFNLEILEKQVYHVLQPSYN
ncbi:MAG: glycosyltransferase [Rivularia sp. (in: cyanobacteria)]